MHWKVTLDEGFKFYYILRCMCYLCWMMLIALNKIRKNYTQNGLNLVERMLYSFNFLYFVRTCANSCKNVLLRSTCTKINLL